MMINDAYIENFENKNNLIIPSIYKEFLKQNNGRSFEGGELLYSLDDIIEMNQGYSVQLYQPEFIAIGDNGGGFFFLMKQEANSKDVYIVDMVELDIDTCEYKVDDLFQWIDNCFFIPNSCNDEDCGNVDVLLIKTPKNGLSGLLEIKKGFSLTVSAKELLMLSKNLPCVLVTNINIGLAKKMASKVSEKNLFRFEKHQDK